MHPLRLAAATLPGTPLTVRSGPGTGCSPVGTVVDGGDVTIYRQTAGATGTNDIWDRIGTGWFIPDAYVYRLRRIHPRRTPLLTPRVGRAPSVALGLVRIVGV